MRSPDPLALPVILVGVVSPIIYCFCGNAEEWVDRRSVGPFVCLANFSLAGQKGILDDLAMLENDLARNLGIRPAGEEGRVYVFRDQPSYVAFLKERYPQVPYRRALYVKNGGPGAVFAYRSPRFEIDLRHECTHALLHASVREVPLWLDEGLAGYFEMTPSQRSSGHPHLAEVQAAVRRGIEPRLADLEGKTELSQMGAAEYRDAWAWVHFMFHGSPVAGDEMRRYLADLRASKTPERLNDRLRRRLPAVEQLFREHFSRWGVTESRGP
jgi:hypothetical protein